MFLLFSPYLDQYVRTANRLAFGERTVIVMSSKVAQKSYGTEKRFLCPPPTAIMIGNSWWSETVRRGEEPKQAPPRVVISISGEPVPQEGSVEWTSTSGKSFDVNDPPVNTTYIGRCVGKQLFISDVDEKKKKVEALVKIMAPASDDEPERIIGTFPSRPIKVISKPSKRVFMTSDEIRRICTGRRAQQVKPLGMGEIAVVRTGSRENEWIEAREAIRLGLDGEVICRAR